jgi:hypothetical protein
VAVDVVADQCPGAAHLGLEVGEVLGDRVADGAGADSGGEAVALHLAHLLEGREPADKCLQLAGFGRGRGPQGRVL